MKQNTDDGMFFICGAAAAAAVAVFSLFSILSSSGRHDNFFFVLFFRFVSLCSFLFFSHPCIVLVVPVVSSNMNVWHCTYTLLHCVIMSYLLVWALSLCLFVIKKNRHGTSMSVSRRCWRHLLDWMSTDNQHTSAAVDNGLSVSVSEEHTG